MNITKRKPFSPGEMLVGEFLEQLNLTHAQLADRIKIPHNLMNAVESEKN